MRMNIYRALAAAGLAVALIAPATASAGELTLPVTTTAESIESCVDPTVSPLLAGLGDTRSYFVAPGGDFEDGAAGWQLAGGATIAPGSNGLGIVGGSSSLKLGAGSSAISPAFCVDERFPSFRMAAAQLGAAKANVKVQVVYPGQKDNVDDVGKVESKTVTDWGLTPDMAIDTKVPGWHRIALRLSVDKVAAASDVRVDDVVIDPRLSR
jgi:hypothetical protein